MSLLCSLLRRCVLLLDLRRLHYLLRGGDQADMEVNHAEPNELMERQDSAPTRPRRAFARACSNLRMFRVPVALILRAMGSVMGVLADLDAEFEWTIGAID